MATSFGANPRSPWAWQGTPTASGAERSLPSGVVTFLFTDIEGSTRILKQLPEDAPPAFERHDEIIRSAVSSHGGHEVGKEGDAFFVAFDNVDDALQTCATAQHLLANESWPDSGTIRVRMGVHSGVAAPRNDNYVALAVHQAARIVSVAHGGQIVLSDTALQEVHHSPPGTTVALGRFRVRDFDKPELLHRLDPLLSSWSIGGQKLGQDIEALPGEGKFNEKTIVNMSFGGYADSKMVALEQAIRRIRKKKAVVVASAGNDGTSRPMFPACFSDVVGVAALDPYGPAPYSNHGSWVRACAPGTDLVSAFFKFDGKMELPPMPGSSDPDKYDHWARWTGTSFAAPLVAAALLRHMKVTGEIANDAVKNVIDAPGLFRLPDLGTVVNLVPPDSGCP